jgi:hypothetical protein
MMRSTLAAGVLFAGLGAAALPASGCEYIVRLDRGLVDAGGDAGCPICSKTDDEDGGDSDAAVDAASMDATLGDANLDARGE